MLLGSLFSDGAYLLMTLFFYLSQHSYIYGGRRWKRFCCFSSSSCSHRSIWIWIWCGPKCRSRIGTCPAVIYGRRASKARGYCEKGCWGYFKYWKQGPCLKLKQRFCYGWSRTCLKCCCWWQKRTAKGIISNNDLTNALNVCATFEKVYFMFQVLIVLCTVMSTFLWILKLIVPLLPYALESILHSKLRWCTLVIVCEGSPSSNTGWNLIFIGSPLYATVALINNELSWYLHPPFFPLNWQLRGNQFLFLFNKEIYGKY